jgi:hypothetical protein
MERALMFERTVEVVSGEPLDWNLKRTDGVAI